MESKLIEHLPNIRIFKVIIFENETLPTMYNKVGSVRITVLVGGGIADIDYQKIKLKEEESVSVPIGIPYSFRATTDTILLYTSRGYEEEVLDDEPEGVTTELIR